MEKSLIIVDEISSVTEEQINAVLMHKLYPNLIPAFLQCMDEIGAYGHAKYGEQSFQHRRLQGNTSRYMDRVEKNSLYNHSTDHWRMYMYSKKHDHFKTLKHQLAAAAFNAMMEFHFACLSEEKPE